MAGETNYYAIINDLSSRARPTGVLRRVKHEGGERDETFGSDLTWGRSSLLHAYENGDLTNKFIPITEDEAAEIADRIRAQVSGIE